MRERKIPNQKRSKQYNHHKNLYTIHIPLKHSSSDSREDGNHDDSVCVLGVSADGGREGGSG